MPGYSEHHTGRAIDFISEVSEDEVSVFLNRIGMVDLKLDSARDQLLQIITEFVPTFNHVSGEKFLNSRM